MSKKLPFEDAFKKKMSDLPVGNEDASWLKMKQLLEEKEKRKPFAWLNVYSVCSCIIILTGLAIGIIISNNNKQNNIAKTENNSVGKKNEIKNKQNRKTSIVKSGQTNKTSVQKNKADTFLKQKNVTINRLNTTHSKHIFITENCPKNFRKQSSAQTNSNLKDSTTTSKQNLVNKNNNVSSATQLDSLQNKNYDNHGISKNNSAKENTELSSYATIKKDSSKNETVITNVLKQTSNFDSATVKKQSSISFRKKQFFVEAGIQLKQQIPLNGQKIIAYNYNNDKTLLKDYIPSVFIKFEKSGLWFFQGEFSYATPQLVKQFSYSQQTKADYTLSTVTVITANLQKTYYSKIPLSFNYYVQPHWLIGTGVTYNWFHGAVAEQQITTNDIKAGTFMITKTIIPFKNFTDSFLYKSQASVLLQTGYSLKRWSFMLRYEKGIQPYMKYMLPNGDIENKKKSLLELNIGYRFIKKPF